MQLTHLNFTISILSRDDLYVVLVHPSNYTTAQVYDQGVPCYDGPLVGAIEITRPPWMTRVNSIEELFPDLEGPRPPFAYLISEEHV